MNLGDTISKGSLRESLLFIDKFIHHMHDTGVSHAVMFTVVVSVSKYHFTYKSSGIKFGRYSLVKTAKKSFW